MATIIEDADAASSTATAYRMAAGDEFYGINLQGASDWIAVTLQAGQTYNFGAAGIGPANTGVTDPLIKLHAAGGALLASSDDSGPGLSSSLTFTAGSTGTYYVEVKALVSKGDGVYGLAVTEGDMPSYSTELGAAIIYREGDTWTATPGTAVNLTWGVRTSGVTRDANGDFQDFEGLTAAQITATATALRNFSDVSNLTFTRVNPAGTTNNATILVGAYTSTTDGAGAYAQFPGSKAASSSDGDLWINNDSVSQTSLKIGTYDYWVFMHELGHAMGLAHPGDYNAEPGVDITYANSAQFLEDSNQYTIMSYFDAVDTEAAAPSSYADTLMLFDIYALQKMYGVNHATRAGNDIYGFHSTVGGAYDFTVNRDPLMCIWDGAGRDTLDLSGFRGKQIIDLNAGGLSDVGGYKGNLSIAVNCKIENAIGGAGRDQIYGNDLANVLKGGLGLDVLLGGKGTDRMVGGGGADGFIFLDGDGRDTITDFNKAVDVLSLDSNLWAGETLTETEVLNRFSTVLNGNLFFDFGTDELTLLHVNSTVGLADRILIS